MLYTMAVMVAAIILVLLRSGASFSATTKGLKVGVIRNTATEEALPDTSSVTTNEPKTRVVRDLLSKMGKKAEEKKIKKSDNKSKKKKGGKKKGELVPASRETSGKMETMGLCGGSEAAWKEELVRTATKARMRGNGCPRRSTEVTRTVWMFWHAYPDLGTGKEADFRGQCLEGWRALNPGWQIRVLNMTDALRMAPKFAASFELPPNKRFCIQLQADLLRLELLNQYGGVWADMTTMPVRPLDSWIYDKLSPSGFWAFTGGNFKNVSNQPNHTQRNCFEAKVRKDRVVKCYSWKYVNYQNYNIALNWFIAASGPGNPVIQAWLATYYYHLKLIDLENPIEKCQSPPYFLQACTFGLMQQRLAAIRELTAKTPSDPLGELKATTLKRQETYVDGHLLLYKRSEITLGTYREWLLRENVGPFSLEMVKGDAVAMTHATPPPSPPPQVRVPVLFLPLAEEPATLALNISGSPCATTMKGLNLVRRLNSPARVVDESNAVLVDMFRGGRLHYDYSNDQASHSASGMVVIDVMLASAVVNPAHPNPSALARFGCPQMQTHRLATPTLFAWTEPVLSGSSVEVTVRSDSEFMVRCPMHPVSGGFVVVLALVPGRYTYKFFIDGRWRFAYSQLQLESYSQLNKNNFDNGGAKYSWSREGTIANFIDVHANAVN